MNTRPHRRAALVLCMSIAAAAMTGAASGQVRHTDQDRLRQQDQERDMIYGSELMTQQERLEYRDRMRALRTAEERERFRLEHHAQMQARARERGLQLPPVPAGRTGAAGAGAGPGPGPMGAGAAGPGPRNR